MANSVNSSQYPVISGSGRSGTTWIQDVIARSNDLRTAFEPLHPSAIPAMQNYAYKVLDQNEDAAELRDYLQRIFSGQYRDTWVDYRIRPDRLRPGLNNVSSPMALYQYLARWRKLYRQSKVYRKHIGKPVITKFIRASQMYGWLLQSFNMQIVHVTRHPCAVIESKLRLGGDDWDVVTELSRYIGQKPIYDSVVSKIEHEQIYNYDTAGKYAIIWCIENCLDWSSLGDRVLNVYFETLASHDQAAWQEVITHLGLTHLDTELLARPSQQSRPENSKRDYDKGMTSGWAARLTDTQLAEISDVLDRFNVTTYSVNETEPKQGIA